jgi:hypothetical protein
MLYFNQFMEVNYLVGNSSDHRHFQKRGGQVVDDYRPTYAYLIDHEFAESR